MIVAFLWEFVRHSLSTGWSSNSCKNFLKRQVRVFCIKSFHFRKVTDIRKLLWTDIIQLPVLCVEWGDWLDIQCCGGHAKIDQGKRGLDTCRCILRVKMCIVCHVYMLEANLKSLLFRFLTNHLGLQHAWHHNTHKLTMSRVQNHLSISKLDCQSSFWALLGGDCYS